MRLPPAASERIDDVARGGPWSSQLKVGDEHVLRRLGFESVGIVIGSFFSYVIGANAPPGYKVSARPLGYRTAWSDDPMSAKRSGGYVHDWSVGVGGKPTWDMGWTWERMYHQWRERKAVDEATARLVFEGQALGAHGILNIEFAFTRHGRMSAQEIDYPVFEVRLQGTAVRVRGLDPTPRLFTTGLSAGDVLKLAERGYAPVAFSVGIGTVRGQLGSTSRRRLRSMKNGELHQFSEVTAQSLKIAREDLERRSSGDGIFVLGNTPELDVEWEHGVSYDVTTRIPGSAIRRFRAARVGPLNFMPVVSVNEARANPHDRV